MKHVIIGTAGHVDHGKTVLIRALTGIDTDRLIEEKRRGITIELGFAHLDWPDGVRAGIVDVPGHEKFIRNMLSGAGGIDVCMLVVAADEGFMPQTVEHLNILTLLGIRDGLTVITKKDAVDGEWLELMTEEVKERLKGTFLENRPVLAVSAKDGDGIAELKAALRELIDRAAEKSARVPFRLPVDRVFSVDGFGTVVTGTLIEGCVHTGEEAELLPGGLKARVRSLQVHSEEVPVACAGERVAINLSGIRKEEVARGDTVAKPGTVRTSLMADARLSNLKDSGRVIENGMQVHFYHGATVRLAKVVLLDKEKLEPGENGLAQLRLTEPLASKNGDRFVIRFYSPVETIGGGVILDDKPVKHKRFVPAVLEALAIRESGSLDKKLVKIASEKNTPWERAALALKAGLTEEEAGELLTEAVSRGEMLELLPGKYIAAASLEAQYTKTAAVLSAYHKQNPLHAGMPAAEVRQKAFSGIDKPAADAYLMELVSEGRLNRRANAFSLADFSVKYTKRQAEIRTKLLKIYADGGIEPAGTDEIAAIFPVAEKNNVRQVTDSLLSSGELVLLCPQIIYSRAAYETAFAAVKAHFESHEAITLAELRDALHTSRKYALAILEYLDKNGITKKTGDFRTLRK